MHHAARPEPVTAAPPAGGDERDPGDVDRPGAVGDTEDAELTVPYWLTSTEEAAKTTFLRMVRRLLRDAWLLAWRASPGTTAAVLLLQNAAGVASAAGVTHGRGRSLRSSYVAGERVPVGVSRVARVAVGRRP
jgi:ATP-binding cassette, subfamily B, bacterial